MGLARKSELKNQLTKYIVFNSQNVHLIVGMLVVKQVSLLVFVSDLSILPHHTYDFDVIGKLDFC